MNVASAGAAPPEGVLVVDKPGGMTSHDVVARVRRLLGTRRVGHAGTLDPMATGVLVVLVGEATKLGPYLTADHKRYLATVAFGHSTDTLDAEGRTTHYAPAPDWLRGELAEGAPLPGRPRLDAAIAAETARSEQVPPAYSAIHVDGKRSYDLARAGAEVVLPPRPVAVRRLQIQSTAAPAPPAEPSIVLRLDVAKGYYVRSLARDLGDRLGVPAHLASLRREASGSFTLAEDAVPLDAGSDALRAALIPVATAATRALPLARLTAAGAARARQGKTLAEADFAEVAPAGDALAIDVSIGATHAGEATAWLDPEGRLVAIGARLAVDSATDPAVGGAAFVIHRGFVA